MFATFYFFDFEFLMSFEKLDVRIWFGYIWLSLLIEVFRFSTFIPSLHVFMVVSHFCVVFPVCVVLCCAYHTHR